MCPSSVRHPSTGYDSFNKFADHLTTNLQPYWFTPSLRPGSTIAICCWLEQQSLLPTSCSGSWTLQHELWAAWRSTTANWHTCFTLSYIGSIDWVTYKLGVTVYKFLHGQAPDYLSELCTSVAQVAERQHLRSTSRRLLVPRFQLDMYGRRTFAIAGPMTWKLFQNNLREPDMQIDCFCRTLKTFLFEQYLAHRAHQRRYFFAMMCYINWHLLHILHFIVHFTYVFCLFFKVYKSIKCDTMKRMGKCNKGIFCAFAHDNGKA